MLTRMPRSPFIAVLVLAAAAASPAQAPDPVAAPRGPQRYCNPIPLPDYPVGRRVRDIVVGEPAGSDSLWLLPHKEQFRELADPTALWHDGKWYLYPSCDMAWVSSDEGRTWQHRPLNIRDVGYAPTVVRHGGRFLLLASDSEMYASTSPLGPFEKLGPAADARRCPACPGRPTRCCSPTTTAGSTTTGAARRARASGRWSSTPRTPCG